MNSDDIRYIQTEKKITDAFISLLSNRTISDIKTGEIIARAGIHKTTFYDHYRDKYDLLDRQENRFLDGFYAVSADYFTVIITSSGPSDDLDPYYRAMAEYVYQNRRILSLIFQNAARSGTIRKMSHEIVRVWTENGLASADEPMISYLSSAIASLICAIIEKWIERNFTESIEEFTAIGHQLGEGIQYTIAAHKNSGLS